MKRKIFTGSSHVALSKKVADIINQPLARAKTVRFDNSEIKVIIKERVKDASCLIIQSTNNPTDTHLMELLFFADTLKRNGAKEIIAFIPYFGYARQNREHQPGESVSVNLVIRLIEYVGISSVYTINLHDEATECVFSIKFKNIDALPFLAKKVKEYFKQMNYQEEIVIVSPDQGGIERAQNFANDFLNEKEAKIVVIEKKRNLDEIHQSKAVNIFGQVKDKACLIVDDILTSGLTLVNAAKLCLEKGAKRVLAVVVHHDLSPKAVSFLLKDCPIEKIFTTDTIPLKKDQLLPIFQEISIAPLIAKEIKNL